MNNNDHILQPLREVGTEEKSQFWDSHDIQAALREAYRLGINPQSLAASPDAGEAEGDEADDTGVLLLNFATFLLWVAPSLIARNNLQPHGR